MKSRVVVLALATLLAACNPPAETSAQHKPSLADANTPRTCRAWTIATATLECSATVLQNHYSAVNAKRIASAQDKLSRYGALRDDLCKDPGAAKGVRDAATAYALSDASTRVDLDRTTQPATIVSLCHDAVIKIVARREEAGAGRATMADLHPNVDDTPHGTAAGGGG